MSDIVFMDWFREKMEMIYLAKGFDRLGTESLTDGSLARVRKVLLKYE